MLIFFLSSFNFQPAQIMALARSVARRKMYRDEKISVILVEQNSRMALKISKRTYAPEAGRIALTGRWTDLLHDDHIRKLYLGLGAILRRDVSKSYSQQDHGVRHTECFG